MRYEIQIHHDDEWHTLGHTLHATNAITLMHHYANNGVDSRVRRDGQTVAMTIQPRFGRGKAN